MPHHGPEIRRRKTESLRKRDGLISFARDETSQNGEDGIIAKIFDLIPHDQTSRRFCVDVGAWDGRHLSNTYSLLSPRCGSQVWSGVLIEGDESKFHDLQSLHNPLGNVCIHEMVSCEPESERSLVSLLRKRAVDLPKEFEFLCIDVDGADYWLLHDLWNSGYYRPKVVCVEANPTMPNDLVYIPPRNDQDRHGASVAALVELAQENSYVLVETTLYNAFFVQQDLYLAYFRNLVPDTRIEALHEVTMGTSAYQLYDGSLKLWGCKKLLWHRIPIVEKKIQMLPMKQRNFPFAPQKPASVTGHVVNMAAYCGNGVRSVDERRQFCAKELCHQLRSDGFVLVRGTGLDSDLCQNVLRLTNEFLQEADESVRRSCLSEDRARRGYSPMCTENFASLIGAKGPNDLVRKFRIGHYNQTLAEGSPLHRPNKWPSAEVWDKDSCEDFRENVEQYYGQMCRVANSIVHAICDGLVKEQPTLMERLQPISNEGHYSHTSILTLLGYRRGTRHKTTVKKRLVHPLVAAHTDVGVITVLLFDGGDSAVLQRKVANDGKEVEDQSWADVTLPSPVPHDPVFVVNIGDCFSDLSDGYLPSTLHRVMPCAGSTPRNCLALFVGLDPKQMLTSEDGTMTYEEWRKKKILQSQRVLNKHKPNARVSV